MVISILLFLGALGGAYKIRKTGSFLAFSAYMLYITFKDFAYFELFNTIYAIISVILFLCFIFAPKRDDYVDQPQDFDTAVNQEVERRLAVEEGLKRETAQQERERIAKHQNAKNNRSLTRV